MRTCSERKWNVQSERTSRSLCPTTSSGALM